MSNPIDRYTQIEAILASTGLELSVSEVHGTVVGALANHLKSSQSPDLLKLVEPGVQSGDDRYAQLSELLYDVYRENSEHLLGGQDGFELLLPDDDEDINVKTEGLASWSRGYLLGLLYNDAFSIDQLPESGPEIVRDMMQIAEAAAGSDAEQEEDWALAELHEFVKVGVQLIFEFIYSEQADNESGAEHSPQ